MCFATPTSVRFSDFPALKWWCTYHLSHTKLTFEDISAFMFFCYTNSIAEHPVNLSFFPTNFSERLHPCSQEFMCRRLKATAPGVRAKCTGSGSEIPERQQTMYICLHLFQKMEPAALMSWLRYFFRGILYSCLLRVRQCPPPPLSGLKQCYASCS